jgi:hypothetical protein
MDPAARVAAVAPIKTAGDDVTKIAQGRRRHDRVGSVLR